MLAIFKKKTLYHIKQNVVWFTFFSLIINHSINYNQLIINNYNYIVV